MRLDVNTSAVVKFTNKLEKLHRSAFPVVVRQTLNSAAMDVKRVTMPITTQDDFTNREKNFFKANSQVNFASGFNINSMRSIVGFTDNKLKGNSNFSVKDLVQQEYGGVIKNKSLIPLNDARKAGSKTSVKPSRRLNKITGAVKQSNIRGNKRQTFIKAVHKAGSGGYFIGGNLPNQNTLFRVARLSKSRFSLEPLYDYKKNRTVKVKSTFFMKRASIASSRKMERFYVEHARDKIAKSIM